MVLTECLCTQLGLGANKSKVQSSLYIGSWSDLGGSGEVDGGKMEMGSLGGIERGEMGRDGQKEKGRGEKQGEETR